MLNYRQRLRPSAITLKGTFEAKKRDRLPSPKSHDFSFPEVIGAIAPQAMIGSRFWLRSGRTLTTAKWTIEDYHRIVDSGVLDARKIAVVHRLGAEYRQHHPYPENIFWLIEYADSSLKKDLGIKKITLIPVVQQATG